MSRCDKDARVAIMGRMLRDGRHIGRGVLTSYQGGDFVVDTLAEAVAWMHQDCAREGLACSVEC